MIYIFLKIILIPMWKMFGRMEAGRLIRELFVGIQARNDGSDLTH